MKPLKHLLTAACLIASTAFAQTEVPNLGRPEKLLEQANQGRKELLDVLLKMKDNVRELRDQTTFDEFFAILDPLQSLSQKYNLDLIYPQAVQEVGKSMIMHGNRWLRVSKDTPEKILSYQKWADLTAALQFQVQVEEEITRIQNEALFAPAFSNLLVLETWAKQKFANDLYLVPTYQKLIASLSFKALIQTDVKNEKEWSFWIKGVNNQTIAQDYIGFLNEKVLETELDQESFNQWMKLNLALGVQLNTIPRISGSIRNNYGVLVSDTIGKALYAELVINPEIFEKTIALLDVSSIRGLAFRWVNPEKSYSDEYSKTLIPLSSALYNKAKELKLGQTALEIERFVSARLSPVLATQSKVEGTYLVVGSDEREWIFTVIRESESRMIAALCDKEGVVCFSFFNLQYSLQNKIFLATENLPDDDHYANAPAQIAFQENGQIRIDFPYSYRIGTVFKGKKVEDHQNIMAHANNDAVAIEGHFKGTIEFKNGTKTEADMMISSVGEYTVGRIESQDSSYRLDFGKGTDGKAGYIYLTSGRNLKGSWVHIRLKQLGYEEVEGVIIGGGMGEIAKVRFTRTYDYTEE